MAKLAVEFVKRHETDEFAIRVTLSSDRKTGVATVGYIDADATNIETKVASLGADLATRQNILYNDMHDPDQVARVAEGAMRKLKARGVKTNQIIEERGFAGASPENT
jgi:hypothetical protein